MLNLLAGAWIAQAVSTAASLGVSDALKAKPLTLEELALEVNCVESMLERLLMVLVGEGVYAYDSESERYSNTELGRLLTKNEGLRSLASFLGSPSQWTPWSDLSHSLRNGKPAFVTTHGASLYEWLDTHPEDAQLYDRAIDKFTDHVADEVAKTYDFSGVRRLVDVGGGLGTTTIRILQRWPHIEGVLVERGAVLDRARSQLKAHQLEHRCQIIERDFLEPLPTGGDIYLVKHVLHNWGDKDAKRILNGCRMAMTKEGRLLVIEGVLNPGIRRDVSRLMDLQMMMLFGEGRTRKKAEFKRLFRAAGFRLEHTTVPLDTFARLLVGVPT